MKKLFLSLQRLTLLTALLLMLPTAMWGSDAPIAFSSQTSGTSDSGTAYTTSNFVSSGISSSDNAFGTITCSSTSKCYSGKKGYGLKLGASSNQGSFTLSFSSPITNVSSIVINCASYSSKSGNNATITVTSGNDELGRVTTTNGSADFSDKPISDLSISSLSTLSLSSTKYCYVKSITITYSGGTDSRAEVNMTNFYATESTLIKDNTTTTTVTNDQRDWTPAYKYESSNTNVATVSNTGVITAVAKGTAKITASLNIANDDATWKKGATASKTIDITVNNPSHIAHFSVNGIIDSNNDQTVEEGSSITFPSDPTDIQGKKYVGWTKTKDYSNAKDAPLDLCKSAAMGNNDVTYYAVFAKSEGTTQWQKVSLSGSLTAGTYIIINSDGYAFTGEITTGSNFTGHGAITSDAFTFTNNIATSAPAGACELTLELKSSNQNQYTLYNSSRGYLYAKAASSGNLDWHENETSYWLCASSNLKYSSNSAYLRSYNNNTFRTYSSTNSTNTSAIAFAKKITNEVNTEYATKVKAKYNVKFYVDGSENTSLAQIVLDGDNPTTVSEPTKENYHFDGWYEASDFSGDAIEDVTSVTITNHKDFFGRFLINHHNVIFHMNDGSEPEVTTTQDFAYNETKSLDANSFERAEYNFTGWSTTSTGDKEYDDGDEFTLAVDNDVDLFAVWAHVSALEVTYNGFEELEFSSKPGHVSPNATSITSAYTVTTGYTVKGITVTIGETTLTDSEVVFDQNSLTITPSAGFTGDVVITFDVQLIAWTVTFNGNNLGTPESTKLTETEYQGGIILPECNPTDASKRFLGWADSNDAAEPNIVAGDDGKYHPTKDIEVFAVYMQLYQVTIREHEHGNLVVICNDNPVESGSYYAVGDVISITATPADESYKFRNLQVFDATTHTYTASNTRDWEMGAHDIIIEANFDAKNRYTINYYVNGLVEKSQADIYEGTTLVFPEVSDMYGKKFMGWKAESGIDGVLDEFEAFAEIDDVLATKTTNYYAVFATQDKAAVNVTAKLTISDTETCSYTPNLTRVDDKKNNWVSYACIAQQTSNRVNYYLIQINKNSNGYYIGSPEFSHNITAIKAKGWNTNSNERYIYLKANTETKQPSTSDYGTTTIGGNSKGVELDFTINNEASFKQFYIYSSGAVGFEWIEVTCSAPAEYSAYCTDFGQLTLAAYDEENKYWATFSNEDMDVVFEDGVTVYTVSGASGAEIAMTEVDGREVPAKNGILLKTENRSVYYYGINEAGALSNNDLKPGMGKVIEGETGHKYYLLGYGTSGNHATLGFWWGAEGGAPFKSRKGAAYLDLTAAPTGSPVRGFSFTDLLNPINPPVATDVEAVNKYVDTQKMLVRGQLVIVRGNKMFDMNGRLVK